LHNDHSAENRLKIVWSSAFRPQGSHAPELITFDYCRLQANGIKFGLKEREALERNSPVPLW
jgi:hypothetical protein